MLSYQKFLDSLVEISKNEGENIWQLPLTKDYKEYLKSDVADIKNCSDGGKGGTVSAAVFLQQFIKKNTDWIHLDIAGTAYRDRSYQYQDKGATGLYLKSLVEFVKKV